MTRVLAAAVAVLAAVLALSTPAHARPGWRIDHPGRHYVNFVPCAPLVGDDFSPKIPSCLAPPTEYQTRHAADGRMQTRARSWHYIGDETQPGFYYTPWWGPWRSHAPYPLTPPTGSLWWHRWAWPGW